MKSSLVGIPSHNKPSGLSLLVKPLLSFAVIAALTPLSLSHAVEETPKFKRPNLSALERLGKHVFFDNISNPSTMSCSSCHDPATGWTGADSEVNAHQVGITGADTTKFGSLKPPSSGYATLSKALHECNFGVPGVCGGNFWNGRSIGFFGIVGIT